MNWRHMRHAPKDGSRIIILHLGVVHSAVWDDDNHWWLNVASGLPLDPDLWIPCPKSYEIDLVRRTCAN